MSHCQIVGQAAHIIRVGIIRIEGERAVAVLDRFGIAFFLHVQDRAAAVGAHLDELFTMELGDEHSVAETM